MRGQNSLDVTVGPQGIVASSQKLWGQVGGQIVFNITNDTAEPQTVSIPPAEIVPSPTFGADAFPFPLASGRCRITIPPGDKAHLVATVKGAAYFQGRWRAKGMTYTFTIYANDHFLDPDLEINP